jgi:hypothetical protein
VSETTIYDWIRTDKRRNTDGNIGGHRLECFEQFEGAVILYDATMGKIEGAFNHLENYFRQIDVSQADGVIFCADGGHGYWPWKSETRFANEINIR